MKTNLATYTIAAIAMVSPMATALHAGPVTWTIQNPLAFGLGGSLTGSFQYDASTNAYSNLQLSMTADLTPAFGPGDISVPWEPFIAASDPSTLVFGITVGGPFDVELQFANPLTNSGGTDTISRGFVADIREFLPGNGGAGDDSSVNAATITAAATPEPGTVSLAIPGLLVLVAKRRWRRVSRAKSPSKENQEIER